jgi:hypothetical protein
VFNS